MPAGAIIGVRILDDGFARELSKRTGAAIGFYANGARVSSGAPEGFDTAQLDTITSDLKGLDGDPSYKEKGFSDVRTMHDDLGVVYARLSARRGTSAPATRWRAPRTSSARRSGFLHSADDKDKQAVPLRAHRVRLAALRGARPRVQLSRAHAPARTCSASRPSASPRATPTS